MKKILDRAIKSSIAQDLLDAKRYERRLRCSRKWGLRAVLMIGVGLYVALIALIVYIISLG